MSVVCESILACLPPAGDDLYLQLALWGVVAFGILIPVWVVTYHGWGYWPYGLALAMMYAVFVSIIAAFVALGPVGLQVLMAAGLLGFAWLLFSMFGS